MTAATKGRPVSYRPAVVVILAGLTLLAFGIAADTTAATVGGVVLGAAVFGLGILRAAEVRLDRWVAARAAENLLDRLHAENQP